MLLQLQNTVNSVSHERQIAEDMGDMDHALLALSHAIHTVAGLAQALSDVAEEIKVIQEMIQDMQEQA